MFINNVTGAILAGGKGSRMGGMDKGLLMIDGKTIMERTLEVLGKIFDKIIILSNDSSKYCYQGIPCYEDIIKDSGSLGGIYSGLIHSGSSHTFFAPCDMPFLSEELIRFLAGAVSNEVDVIVPKFSDGWQPLHAIYSKRCIPIIEERIHNKDYKIINFYEHVNVKIITEAELGNKMKSVWNVFYNINNLYQLKAVYECGLRKNESVVHHPS